VPAIAEVVGREKVIIVHDRHQVSGSDSGHFILAWDPVHDLVSVKFSHLLEPFLISRMVAGHTHPLYRAQRP